MKDKEWLIKELRAVEVDDYDTSYNGDFEDGLAYALKLAHQLDEPDEPDEPEQLYYLKISENQYAQWFDEENGELMLVNSEAFAGLFTEQEIKAINPNLMLMVVEVAE